MRRPVWAENLIVVTRRTPGRPSLRPDANRLRTQTGAISITERAVVGLRSNTRNARTHAKRQIRQIADSIAAFGFLIPVVVDEDDVVLAGHGRLEAAKFLGMTTVPAIRATDLSDAQKRAFVLADNRIAQGAGWDRQALAAELGELAVLLPELELDLTITGFEPPELDALFADHGPATTDPVDEVPVRSGPGCTRPCDLWCLGPHRVFCGDAQCGDDVDMLMGGRRARVIFTDPPYNVPIAGHVQGRGRVKHRPFAFASGEMTTAEFRAFLRTTLGHTARSAFDGAIAYVCMDWRHMVDLHEAGLAVFTELKNVVVWNKTTPGQGLLLSFPA